MKKEFGAGWLICYIFLEFFCCVMSFFISNLIFEQELLGFIFEIPTMGAFIIGAIYLFGGDKTNEDSKELPEHKDNDE